MVRRVRHCRSCPARFVTSEPALLECGACCAGGNSQHANQKPAAAAGTARPRQAFQPQQQPSNASTAVSRAAGGSSAEATECGGGGGEPVPKKQRAATASAAAAAAPPVFDLYEDNEEGDEDEDDQPLLALAAGDIPPPPPADAVGQNQVAVVASSSNGRAGNLNGATTKEDDNNQDEEEIIDLLSSSDDDEEDDGDDDDADDSILDDDDDEGASKPILPDFGAQHDEPEQQIPRGSSFQRQQEELHANAAIVATGAAALGAASSMQSPQQQQQPPNGDSHSAQDACFICGVSLRDRKQRQHRLDHIKRCSKRHGVSARDVRRDDDAELFVVPDGSSSGSSNHRPRAAAAAAATATDQQNPSTNPYLRRKNDWHGDAAQDLAAAGGMATTTNNNNTNSNNNTQATSSSAAAPSVHQLLMAGARRAAKTQHIQRQQKRAAAANNNNNNPQAKKRFYNNGFGGPQRHFSACPKHKIISGTDFCVDGFHYADPALTSNYFLSHFHSDHYGGLTRHWKCGVIYCSAATARLAHQQLGVDRRHLHPLPLRTPTVLPSGGGGGSRAVTVTLLDANHCPGAVMFLFEIAGGRAVLHVGDFRWNYHRLVARQAPLRPYSRVPWQSVAAAAAADGTATVQPQPQPQKRIDDLYLDTTYCDPKHILPSQADCIAAAVAAAVREVERAQAAGQRLLLLFGAYTIGKEAVYLAVARRLGLKVYVDPRRFRILSALDGDELWAGDNGNPKDLLTTRPQDSILWVVPLGHINMKKLPSYAKIRRRGLERDFDRVVGFRPTGWSLPSGKATKNKNKKSSTATSGGVVGTVTRGPFTVHSVPYSEHSSFPELVECLECLNPRRIIPTVSVSKSQQQIDTLLAAWRAKQAEHFL